MPSAALHNGILVRGYKRADEISLRLARVLEPILARAGQEAARAFRDMATDYLTASAPGVKSTSTKVALYPRPEEARAIEHAAPGEPAENIHLTLAFLGDTEGPLTDLIAALRAVGAEHAPLEGEVAGIGAFQDGGEGHPGILLPDVPGLGELRLATCRAILEAGQEYATNHGFLPHLTVAYYGDDLTFPSRDSFGAPLHFDHLVLARGDERLAEIPLVGPRPLTASAGWSAPAGDELVNVKALVSTLHTKTDPIRQALVESVMKPTLGGAGIAFDVTNPLTAKVLAQSGSQIVGIAETTQLNVMRIVRESYDQGLSIPDTAKAIQGGMRSAAFTRATLIARTEMAGAVNGGSLAAARIFQEAARDAGEAEGEGLYKQWLTADGALYPRHELDEELDGQTVRMDEYFDVGGESLEYPGDPAGSPEETCNCRCVAPWTPVSGAIHAGSRRAFEGELVRLTTSAGREVSVTPNHPILTRRGWVYAGEIQKGDHLLCRSEFNGAVGSPYVEDVPPEAEQRFAAMQLSAARRERVDGRAVNFHGEVAVGEVDVIWADDPLALEGESAVGQKLGELALALAHREVGLYGGPAALQRVEESQAVRLADPSPLLAAPFEDHAYCLPTNAEPLREREFALSGAVASNDLGGDVGAGVVERLPQAVASRSADPAFAQSPPDGHGGDARLARDLLVAHPGLVEADPVVDVVLVPFRGHVYNFTSTEGVFSIDGIVSGNCTLVYTNDASELTNGEGTEKEGEAGGGGGGAGRAASIATGGLNSQSAGVVERALLDIARVHRVPEGTGSLGSLVEEGARVAYDANRGLMLVGEEGLDVAETHAVVHEYGHFLDREVFGGGRFASAAGSPEMAGLTDAIESSRASAVWREEASRSFESAPEKFARAYEQWVADRSGSEEMRAVQREARHRGVASYWEDADFKPIAKEFDDLFARRGLLAESPGPVAVIDAPAANATVTTFTAEQVHEMTTGDLWRAMSSNGRAENAARADIAMEQTRVIADELWARGDAKGLPPGTLRYNDLQGEQHLHSIYSDGHNTIEEMAESARSHGMKQIVVSDHSHLLTAESIARQHAEIDALNRSYADRGLAFRVVKGVEANILEDGTLDLTDAVLKRFDVVNAGMHVDRALNATERYLRVLDNPRVTTIAHPHTGGDVVDWDALAKKAAEKGVTLEVNGRDILRLDNGTAAKKMIASARQAGAKITIASDAHNELNVVDTLYGVRFAAKEGVTVGDLAGIQLRDTISVEGEAALTAETIEKIRVLKIEQGVPGPKALAVLGQARDTRELYTVEFKPVSMTREQAIAYYHTPKAFDLNAALRAGKELTAEQDAVVRGLDAAFEPAPRDMVLWRGVPDAPDVFAETEALDRGLLREVSTPGYLSTSEVRDDAMQFASGISGPGDKPVIERIEIKKGTPILRVPAGDYGDQHEILLPRAVGRESRGATSAPDPFMGGRIPVYNTTAVDAGVRELRPRPQPGVGYIAERKVVHDRIVDDLLGEHATQERPVALVTAGGPAAGKSVALRAHPEWIPEDSVLVNTDEIMESLPEHESMYGDPYLAAATHEEASDIGGRLLREAIARRTNLVLDGVGDGEPGKFAQKLKELHEAGYDVKVAMADTPTNTAIERSVVRATTEGSPDLNRFVPVNVMKQLYRDAVTRMDEWMDSPFVDEWNLTRTSGGWGDSAVTVVARGGGGSHEILEPDLWKEIQAKRDYVIPGEEVAAPALGPAEGPALAPREVTKLKVSDDPYEASLQREAYSTSNKIANLEWKAKNQPEKYSDKDRARHNALMQHRANLAGLKDAPSFEAERAVIERELASARSEAFRDQAEAPHYIKLLEARSAALEALEATSAEVPVVAGTLAEDIARIKDRIEWVGREDVVARRLKSGGEFADFVPGPNGLSRYNMEQHDVVMAAGERMEAEIEASPEALDAADAASAKVSDARAARVEAVKPIRALLDDLGKKLEARAPLARESLAQEKFGKAYPELDFTERSAVQVALPTDPGWKALADQTAEARSALYRSNLEYAGKVEEAEKALKAANSALVLERREKLMTAMSEVRQMGPAPGAKLSYSTSAKTLPGVNKAQFVLNAAQDFYPRDWLARTRPIQAGMKKRGWHLQQGGYSQIYVSTSTRSAAQGDLAGFPTAIHEIGHEMEAVVPGLVTLERSFYQWRTRGGTWDGPQEAAKSLQKLRPRWGYGKDETAREDQFSDPYFGKAYGAGGSNYELLTMGMESLWTGSYEIDAEFRRWLLGVLALI